MWPWRSRAPDDHAGLRRRLIAAAALLAAVVSSLPVSAETAPLRMLFRDKPPYSYVEAGVAKGFLLERTRAILRTAGVDAHFEEMPPKRLFAEIEANKDAVCSFGWYKIPAREAYARFSRPIHQDRPHVVLARREAAGRLRDLGSLQAIGQRADLSLAIADGVSYGPDIDAWIARFPGPVDKAVIPPLLVAQKVAAGRADFMFIDQDDLDHLRATTPDFAQLGLQTVHVSDPPAGLKRYILCSQQVPEAVMARIDAAIAHQNPAAP